MTQLAILAEHVDLYAPLGIGFWDPVTGTLVDHGLNVSLRPRHVAEPRLRSSVNARGIHVFHRLPGIPAQSLIDDEPGAASPPTLRRFTFEVADDAHRFLPFSFDADCPVSGLFVPACIQFSPPQTAYVPLFSSVTRSAPGGMATVRAELRNANTGAPAAWAVVRVENQGRELGRGLADADGKLVLIFSYPEPAVSSPPAGYPWRWPIRLYAAYATPVGAVPSHPSLCAVLNQPSARLLVDASPAVELGEQQLEFGRDLIVTSGAVNHILVEPA